MLEVEPPPCLVKGYITFGSLDNFVKVNPINRDALAQLVSGVPGTHLLLHMKQLRIQQAVLDFFAQRGV